MANVNLGAVFCRVSSGVWADSVLLPDGVQNFPRDETEAEVAAGLLRACGLPDYGPQLAANAARVSHLAADYVGNRDDIPHHALLLKLHIPVCYAGCVSSHGSAQMLASPKAQREVCGFLGGLALADMQTPPSRFGAVLERPRRTNSRVPGIGPTGCCRPDHHPAISRRVYSTCLHHTVTKPRRSPSVTWCAVRLLCSGWGAGNR